MSVHGEYSRALEELIAWLRDLPDAQETPWFRRFADARVTSDRDLSTAARSCLEALETLEEACSTALTPGGGEHLREKAAHLRAHCRAILGIPRD